MADGRLTVPEQVLLLVLTDRTASLLRDTHFNYALGGAVLTELLLAGRIELEATETQRLVTVVDETPTGDPVLDDGLGQIIGATRRSNPRRWVDRFADHDELHMRVARQLCRKDVLDEHPDRVVLVFRRLVFADLDPEVQEEVTGKVRDAIFGDDTVDARVALTAVLARAGDILKAVFDEDEVAEHEERIENLLDRVEWSEDMKEAVREAESAVVDATVRAVKGASGASAGVS